MEPKPRDPWVVELPKDVKAALDRLLSGDVLRLLLERTGGLLDQVTGGASADGLQTDDHEQGQDDEQGHDDDGYGEGDDAQGEDDDGHHGPSGSCQSSGQASTWWSGSARSGCS